MINTIDDDAVDDGGRVVFVFNGERLLELGKRLPTTLEIDASNDDVDPSLHNLWKFLRKHI